jgi:hypothetical protein
VGNGRNKGKGKGSAASAAAEEKGREAALEALARFDYASPTWDNDVVSYNPEYALQIEDEQLARHVWVAIRIWKQFQLIFQHEVLASAPEKSDIIEPGRAMTLIDTSDLSWDSKGRLTIKNPVLGSLLKAASEAEMLSISVPESVTGTSSGTGGGVTENKVNAMCYC